MRRSVRSVVALLILVGMLATAAARPGSWSNPAADRARLEVEWRRSAEVNTFTHYLTADLSAGRIGLADATDRLVEANADRPTYLEALSVGFPAPTVRESVARCLVHRAEHPPADGVVAVVSSAIRAEYKGLFGREYVPVSPVLARSFPTPAASRAPSLP